MTIPNNLVVVIETSLWNEKFQQQFNINGLREVLNLLDFLKTQQRQSQYTNERVHSTNLRSQKK